MMIRVGAILIGEGIDHVKLVQEFLDNETKDRFGMPVEKRFALYRDSFVELHIKPITHEKHVS